jgi:hypothetical protein
MVMVSKKEQGSGKRDFPSLERRMWKVKDLGHGILGSYLNYPRAAAFDGERKLSSLSLDLLSKWRTMGVILVNFGWVADI